MKKHLDKLTAANRKHDELQDSLPKLAEQHEEKSARRENLQVLGNDSDTPQLVTLGAEIEALQARIEAAQSGVEEARRECVTTASESLEALAPFIQAKEDTLRTNALKAILPFTVALEEALGIVDQLGKVGELNHLARNLEWQLDGRDRDQNALGVNGVHALLVEAVAAEEGTAPARKATMSKNLSKVSTK